MRLQIFVNGLWETDAKSDVRLQKGDEILVPSKKRCAPGMEPEMIQAVIESVKFDVLRMVMHVECKKVDGTDGSN